MMGTQGAAQEQLFYSFILEAHVPSDHLLRGIDCFLDLSSLREHLRRSTATPADLDRPRVDDPHAGHRVLLRHPLGTQAL